MKVQSVGELANLARVNPQVAASLREDPAAALEAIAAPPLASDVWIYRIVVGTLGGTLLLVVMAAAVLAFKGLQTPDVLTALGSAAVGAMAGLLAPSPARG